MSNRVSKKGGGARKIGNQLEKCKRYRDAKRREKNKVKRVLRSSGYAAALAYAKLHSITVPRQVMT